MLRFVGFFLKVEERIILIVLCLTVHEWNHTWCICNENTRMTVFFLWYSCLWCAGNWIYYFNKLLFIATAFLGTFLVETSAAGLRILCESNALACWANSFCCKCKIINSWHNPKLVIVDWSWNQVPNFSGVSDFMLSYKWIDDFYNLVLCQGDMLVSLKWDFWSTSMFCFIPKQPHSFKKKAFTL